MTIEKLQVNLTVLQGTGLVAKDRNLLGKKTTSDPYVEVWVPQQSQQQLYYVGRTSTKPKTLSPQWNQSFDFTIPGMICRTAPYVILRIFDEDKLSDPDNMGVVKVPIPDGAIKSTDYDTTDWYDVPKNSAKNASGKLQVRFRTNVIFSRSLVRGNDFVLESNQVQVGLAWDMLPGKQHVDLDVSCVSIDHSGNLAMKDTVYYANTANSNQSVIHSGDEKEGDEEGDDERILMYLDRVPSHVLAMYIVLTVATPNMRIPDIRSTKLRVYDVTKNYLTLCTFSPASHALSRNSTAMFMVRIARTQPHANTWRLTPIEDTHPTARDFGSLVPYMKSYTKDLVPHIVIDPTERVAILRKGGTVRLEDYCPGKNVPDTVTFGLAWDVTDGVNIDLDASALLLDKQMQLVDQVWWRQLQSQDGSIRHHGDEREGDEIGDDEKMDLFLAAIPSHVQFIGFTINSYSGQELDDVARASCHIFDASTQRDMASYAMTNCSVLDKRTALVVGCLYRNPSTATSSQGWCLSIISEPTLGKLAKDCLPTLQNYLRNNLSTLYGGGVGGGAEEQEEEIVVDCSMPANVPLAEEEIDLSLPAPPVVYPTSNNNYNNNYNR